MASPQKAQLPPNMQQQLQQLELLAQKAYGEGDRVAESVLASFRTDSACIAQSRLILDHSTHQYALLLAAKSLKELLTLYFHTFTGAQTLEIRNYLLNYIANASNNSNIPDFVINALVDVVARVAKLGWRQDPNAPAGTISGPPSAPGGATLITPGSHATFVETCGTFFQHSIRHHQMGLLLLRQLVDEMEKACTVESPSDHRKTSRLFRDHALLSIVGISISELRNVGNFVRTETQDTCVRFLLAAFHLFSACLSFDFIGNLADETSADDSNVTLQVPSTWRTLVEDTTATSPSLLFAQMFEEFPLVEVQAQALNAFTCLASVRRSLFTNEESRIRFMVFLMDTQTKFIQRFSLLRQQNPTGHLEENTEIYHEFARLVARFKCNFSLNDLARSPNFDNWLQSLYLYTIHTGFGNLSTISTNGLSYLLGVWSRIAADVSQLKMSDGSSIQQSNAALNPLQPQQQQQQSTPLVMTQTMKLQGVIMEIIPQMCEMFIAARLEHVSRTLADGHIDVDDYAEMFAEPNLSDQLRYLAVLGRFHYVRIKSYIAQRFEPLVQQYKALLEQLLGNNAAASNMLNGSQANTILQLLVVETQLTILIYLVGAIVGCEKSMLLLHNPSQQHQQNYPFSNADKMTPNDQLQLIDAELMSHVLKVLPIINTRIELSSESAAVARQRTGSINNDHKGLIASRSHLAFSILHFFDNFRRKYLQSLTHQNFESYLTVRTAYGQSLALNPISSSDMSETPNPIPSTPSVPALDTIGHGPGANIFSRTAYFTLQPFTPLQCLQFIVKQILTFLNFISTDFDVVKQTLELFDALSMNYATSGQLSNLDEIKAFLHINQVHTDTNTNGTMMNSMNSSSKLLMSDMLFLQSTSHPRLQTVFYSILARLIFKGSNIDSFPQFIQPISQGLTQLASIPDLRQLPPAQLQQIILLIHKLHGIITSINSSVTFSMFFSWFFEENRFGSLVLRLVETFWNEPTVLYPLLNFYGELIFNKQQRIRFEQNSPNGVILFKETCKIVATYVSRMAMVQPADVSSSSSSTNASNDLYEGRLKGISKVLLLVSRSLHGDYVNFGIMQFYDDKSLRQLLTQSFQFAMSVRFSNIINHPKVATNYFAFIEGVFRSHMDLCVELCDTRQFLAIISSLHEGLLSVHQMQVQQSATALDSLMKWLFEYKQPKKAGSDAARALERHISQSATLLPEILCTLFNINVFDNVDQNWNLSRPIFGLLLHLPDALPFYLQRLLQAQTLPTSSHAELAAKIQSAADGLMVGVKPSLEHSNKDKFQSNLFDFRQKILQCCTRPI